MHEWLRTTSEHLERYVPHVWSVCYPRHILTPAGFLNPKYHSVITAGHLKMMEGLGPDSPPAHTMVALSGICMVRLGMPTYFVEEEFADAAAHIRLPEGLRFGDIRWPLDAMLMVLPESWSRRHFGWHIPFMSLCRCRQGNHPNKEDMPFLRKLELDPRLIRPCYTDVDRFLMSASFLPDADVAPVDYTADYPMRESLSIVKEAPFNDATIYERNLYGLTTAHTAKMPNAQEDLSLTHALVEFAVKLLLAVTARPTVVRGGTLARPEKIKKGRVREGLWNPSMIGAGYRVARPTESLGGTHAAPRLHWRWGHYTHQSKGKRGEADFVSVNDLPKTTEGKIDWDKVSEETRLAFWRYHELKLIDPILVNAPKETNK